MSQQRTRTRTNKKKLKIIPLGGLHEIGKNLTVVEYGEDILLIDCGMAFPENDMFGVDVVIPDFTYLRENSHKIKGLIITHAHEDHIGAVPFLVRYFKLPRVSEYIRITMGTEEDMDAFVKTFAKLV